MMTQIENIIRAITIHSKESFTLKGKTYSIYDLPPLESKYVFADNPFLGHLANMIYGEFYHRTDTAKITVTPEENQEFLQQLSDCASSEVKKEEWIVYETNEDQIYARRGARIRAFSPGQYIHESPRLPRKGESIQAHIYSQSENFQEGFYFFYGHSLADSQVSDSLIRFYWNTTPLGAIEITRNLVAQLNTYQIPFCFKCVKKKEFYTRSDSAVLYLGKRYFQLAWNIVRDVYALVASQVGPEVPLFSRYLAKGLSLAEDPATGESFGMHRCRLLAQGLVQSYTQKKTSLEEQLVEIKKQFSQENIDLALPYRKRKDPYGLDQITYHE